MLAGTPSRKIQSQSSVSSFFDVRLEGENDNKVPVFDTCAVFRTKIRVLLDKKSEGAIPGEFDKDGKPKGWTAKRSHGQKHMDGDS